MKLLNAIDFKHVSGGDVFVKLDDFGSLLYFDVTNNDSFTIRQDTLVETFYSNGKIETSEFKDPNSFIKDSLYSSNLSSSAIPNGIRFSSIR